MNSVPLPRRSKVRQSAVAIIIVLAFVVLLTGLVVAFFSTSILYRQISNSSANATKTDLFAQGALDSIVGDLKQEIAAGSTIVATPAPGVTIYTPNSLAMVPCPVGTPVPGDKPTLNLVKRSGYGLPFYANPTPSSNATPAASPTPLPYDVNDFPPSNRAANIHSTVASLNGRSISPARWNKHLLLPKATSFSATAPYNSADTNDTDFTPVNATAASGSTPASWNYAPDWVLVDRSGNNPTAFNSNMVGSTTSQTTVLGRYAYAIYDEGGLLDVNAAGYPLSGAAGTNSLYTATNSDPKAAYKGALAFADLSQLPGLNTPPLSPAHQEALINNLVGWRNYASAQPSGTLGSFTFGVTPVTSSNPTPAGSIYGYTNLVLGNWTGFLKASNTGDPATTNNQTDRTFVSRQQFLKFLQNAIAQNGSSSAWSATEIAALQNASQYLTTFSRDLDQPSYAPSAGRPHLLPDVGITAPGPTQYGGGNSASPDAYGVNGAQLDDLINPNFAAVRVPTTVPGGRFDFTDLVAGEPVVKKRFNLNRLAWVTWEGPSAGPISANTKNALLANGISETMINEGTAQNIQNYFGLTWVASGMPGGGSGWKYNVHNGGSTGTGSIMRLGRPPSVTAADPTHYVQDAQPAREADFFELLKAAINVGSLGKAVGTPLQAGVANPAVVAPPTSTAPTYPSSYVAGEVPANYRYDQDYSVDHQIIQIGANIIDQFDADSYPTRIVFNDGSNAQEFDGVEDLPYIDYFVNGMLRVEAPGSNPGPNQVNIHDYGNYFPPPAPANLSTPDGIGRPNAQDVGSPGGFTQAPGVGLLVEIPALWNPHDVNGLANANAAQRPTNFRVVADSADPLTVATDSASNSTAGYKSVYVASIAADQYDINSIYSYKAIKSVQPADSSYHIDYSTAQTGQILTASNTAITFSDNAGQLFREPTLLLRTGGGATGPQVAMPAHPQGLTCIDADPLGLPSRRIGSPVTSPGTPVTDIAGTSFAGIVLGAFPLRFSASNPYATPVNGVQAPNIVYSHTAFCGTASGYAPTTFLGPYLTYRVQYKDASGNWVTYDTKYGRVFNGQIDIQWGASTLISPSADPNVTPNYAPDTYNPIFGPFGKTPWSWATTFDPRTARFGLMNAVESWQASTPYCTFASPAEGDSYGDIGFTPSQNPPYPVPIYNPNYGGWISDVASWTSGSPTQTPTTITPAKGVSFSLRPDCYGGSILGDFNTLVPGQDDPYLLNYLDAPIADNPFPKGPAGWSEPIYFSYGFRGHYLFAPGMYTQNNSYTPFFIRRMSTTPQMVEQVNTDQEDEDGQGSGCPQPAYYADADGVVRRAMGGYVPPGPTTGWPRQVALNTIGLPMALTQYSPSASQFTNPPPKPFSQTQSRPYILNRPFRSPAELGYVFSDTPWKNLDFFTPESPDNALLDVFSTTDTDDPMARTAGKVNLNTKQAPVLAAIVSGAYIDDPQLSNATLGTLSSSSSSTIASAIAGALTARTSDTALGVGPLQNIADLAGRWVSNQPVAAPNKPGGPVLPGGAPPHTPPSEEFPGYIPSPMRNPPLTTNDLYDTHFADGRRSYSGFSGPDPSAVDSTTNLPAGSTVPETLSAAYKASSTKYGSGSATTDALIATALNQVQRFHEAPIRALSSTGQTRVWNLLVDLVAQTGRYPQSATTLANFTVEGEQRYWVHLAIDRVTGQVIDKQIELVKE